MLHLAEDDVRAAVQEIAEQDSAFVSIEGDALADVVADDAADQQSDPGNSPKLSEPAGAALEDQLAEKCEQHLRRTAAAGPAD